VVALLRWNGAATVIGAAVVMLLALQWRRAWRAAAVMTVAGLLGFGVLSMVPAVTNVAPLPLVDRLTQKLTDVAYVAAHRPSALSVADRAALAEVAPIRRWQAAGRNCYTVDPVAWHLIRFGRREVALASARDDVSAVWSHVARRAPGTVLRARLCRASLAWNPVDPPGRLIQTLWPSISANPYGIQHTGPGGLHQAALDVISAFRHRWLQAVLWRPVLPLLALIASLVLWRGPRVWRLLPAALAVPVGMLASFAAAPAAQAARYTYAAVVLSQLVTVGAVAAFLQRHRSSARVAPVVDSGVPADEDGSRVQ